MEGLIVLEPFASMIIDGKKTWEIRSREPPENKLDKEVHLLSKGHSLGTIKITDAKGPITKKVLLNNYDLHKSDLTVVDDDFISYIWEINVCKKFDSRKRYVHPMGARVWVKDVILENTFQKTRLNNYF